ncbi:hypothetical protein ACJ72_07389, partial [Emergomyces africanus]
MDIAAIASRSTPQKSDGQIWVQSLTPITVDSSPAAVEPSSPFSPPSPSTLLKTLSKKPSHRATNLQTDGKQVARHGAPRGRPVLGNSPGTEKESGTDSRAKSPIAKEPKRNTDTLRRATHNEIQIMDGDGLIAGPEKGKKKRATAKRTKKGIGVADKKLHGRVSKSQAAGNLELETKSIPSKTCDDALPSVGHHADNEWEWQAKGLQLEHATKRRLDWTPTKDTSIEAVDLADDESLTDVHGKGALFSNYGFNCVVETSAGSKSEDSFNAPTTKRPMELQKRFNNVTGIPNHTESRQSPTTEGSQSSSSKQRRVKAKKPQKAKLTTITSYATAKYSVVDETLDSDHIESIAPKTYKKQSTLKLSSGAKRANPGRRKPTNENGAPVFKVVPPLEAFKSFEGQELLFGTLSQLEQEDPECRREGTQATTKSPNSSNEFSRSLVRCKNSSETSFGSSLVGLSGSKNLWSASARDLTGAVVDVDEIDMSEPSFRLSSLVITKSRCQPDTRDPQLLLNVANIENVSFTTSTNIDARESDNGNKPSFEYEVVCKDKPEPTSTKSNCQPPSSTSEAGLGRAHQDKPIFSGFTMSELAKRVAAYGFKPIKSRDKMISLLEKCWETQTKESNPIPKTNSGDGEAQINEFAKGAQLGLNAPPESNSRTNTQIRSKRPAKNLAKSQELNSLSLSNGSSTTMQKLPIKRSVLPCTLLIDDNQSSGSPGKS